MKNLPDAINSVLANFNIWITKETKFKTLTGFKEDIAEVLKWPEEKLTKLVENIKYSNSQIYQDLFVIGELDFKENGFFVEFGATNGKDINNTYMLEKQFNWSGILAEPATFWHKDLVNNRNCTIEKRCVWKSSGESILFTESEDREFSSISQYNDAGKENEYKVDTISLNDLLMEHNAPSVIDYLSIDTEGSEFEILNAFDFDKYKFRVITCEHNYTKNREKIASLLSKHGYKRKLTGLSRFDDWYVLAE